MEITSGLSGNEDVVVVGKRKLMEGSPVTPAPFNLPEAKTAVQKFERLSPGSPAPEASTSETATINRNK
jgi:hypothetical protein